MAHANARCCVCGALRYLLFDPFIFSDTAIKLIQIYPPLDFAKVRVSQLAIVAGAAVHGSSGVRARQ